MGECMNAIRFCAAILLSAAACAAYAAADVLAVRSGAIGAGDRAAMLKAYHDYNLHFVFAERGGDYLADVRVVVRDAQQRVVWSGISAGPMLFLRLPRGRYVIAAKFEGAERRQTVVAGAGPGKMHIMYW